MQYIIIGDTERYKDCLVMVCGNKRENAEKELKIFQETPTIDFQHTKLSEGHSNFRIKEVEDKNAWWLYETD